MSDLIKYDDSGPLAQFTFLPWFSIGMANVISGGSGGRGKITTSFKLSSDAGLSETITKDIFLLGPGDVTGINKEAIIKIMPQAGSTNFRWNYFPTLEFYEEDLPWRFSPKLRPGGFVAGERIAPWLTLIALKEDEFEATFNARPRPFVTIRKTGPAPNFTPLPVPLPDPSGLWACAHVQISNRIDAGEKTAFHQEVQDLLATQPDLGISRILCLRKLEKNTDYTVFLVPTFKAGALAGLGETPAAIQAAGDSWAWETTDKTATLPIYHHWRFRTGDGDDFEELARKIKRTPVGTISLNRLNIQDLNHELHDDPDSLNQVSKVLSMEAALMPLHQTAGTWPYTSDGDGIIRKELENRINGAVLPKEKAATGDFASDPEIGAPPFYGRWHAAKDQVAGLPWLQDLNLHPGRRVLGGLAAEVVRRWQEELMNEAWEQLGAIREANRKIVQTQMAKVVNEKWVEKHVKLQGENNQPSSADQILSLTSNLHRRLRIEDQKNGKILTVHQVIDQSPLTLAGVNTGLKKILRPNGRLVRLIRKKFNKKLEKHFLTQLNNESITAASGKTTIYEANSDGGTFVKNEQDGTPLSTIIANQDESYTLYQIATASKLEIYASKQGVAETRASIADLTQLSEAIERALAPAQTIAGKTLKELSFSTHPSIEIRLPEKDNFESILAAPKIGRPAYFYLRQLEPNLILPGYRNMEDNTLQVLKTYRPFVEAFLAGLNHEMARELLWREFPTDQRGTYFTQFWDKSDHIALEDQAPEKEDIRPMHLWKDALGTHGQGSNQEFTAFAIRAELLRQYPNVVIYAQKAKLGQDGESHEPDFDFSGDKLKEKLRFPLFRIPMEDVLVIGFTFSHEEARGKKMLKNGDPENQGWYLVFSERPGEPQFGLDATKNKQVLESWSGLSWEEQDIRIADTDYLNVGATTIEPSQHSNIFWNKDAAHFAWILMQQPVRVFRHAAAMM